MAHRTHPHRPLSRRELLAAGGTLGLGAGLLSLGRAPLPAPAAAARAGAACVLSRELTQGPYYLADHLVRRDVTDGQPGLPLALHLSVADAATCAALRGATVEIWHANAAGQYSGFNAPGHFLRGGQVSDFRGRVAFHTVYPGWYSGRATHVHVKVHAGGRVVHTGQLFFDQLMTDAVYRRAPYSARGPQDTPNGRDGSFAQGGPRSMVSLRRATSGYAGSIVLAVRR